MKNKNVIHLEFSITFTNFLTYYQLIISYLLIIQLDVTAKDITILLIIYNYQSSSVV